MLHLRSHVVYLRAETKVLEQFKFNLITATALSTKVTTLTTFCHKTEQSSKLLLPLRNEKTYVNYFSVRSAFTSNNLKYFFPLTSCELHFFFVSVCFLEFYYRKYGVALKIKIIYDMILYDNP